MLSRWKDGPRHPFRPLSPPKHAHDLMPSLLCYFKAGETPRSEDVGVWVNGVPLPMAIEASTGMTDGGQGWAITYVDNGDGTVARDEFGNRIKQTVRGHVEIRLGR